MIEVFEHCNLLISKHDWLVVTGTMEFGWTFHIYYGNVIIPTDFHIFQRGGYTTNQMMDSFCSIESCMS